MDSQDAAKRHTEISRAQQARNLMEHPLLVEAFETLESNLTNAMLDGDRDQNEVLELRDRLLALRAIKHQLGRVMETGRLAERQLAERQPLKGSH